MDGMISFMSCILSWFFVPFFSGFSGHELKIPISMFVLYVNHIHTIELLEANIPLKLMNSQRKSTSNAVISALSNQRLSGKLSQETEKPPFFLGNGSRAYITTSKKKTPENKKPNTQLQFHAGSRTTRQHLQLRKSRIHKRHQSFTMDTYV